MLGQIILFQKAGEAPISRKVVDLFFHPWTNYRSNAVLSKSLSKKVTSPLTLLLSLLTFTFH